MRASTAAACRQKFLEFFPGGFNDSAYLETERAYKWRAHREWTEAFAKGSAAEAYGYELRHSSQASWRTYASALDFARTVRRDVADLHPRDMIDIQSFLWMLGSHEYDG